MKEISEREWRDEVATARDGAVPARKESAMADVLTKDDHVRLQRAAAQLSASVQRMAGGNSDSLPLTRGVWKGLQTRIIQVIAGVQKRAAKRMDVFEKRLHTLESDLESGVQYRGIFEEGRKYEEASLVTHRGGLWISTWPTDERPGGSDSGWKLVVKSGGAV